MNPTNGMVRRWGCGSDTGAVVVAGVDGISCGRCGGGQMGGAMADLVDVMDGFGMGGAVMMAEIESGVGTRRPRLWSGMFFPGGWVVRISRQPRG